MNFQRAHILLSMDKLEDALAALLLVREQVPKEPPVHALLGQIYHRLGQIPEALEHFNAAIDLDPKEAAPLKVYFLQFPI